MTFKRAGERERARGDYFAFLLNKQISFIKINDDMYLHMGQLLQGGNFGFLSFFLKYRLRVAKSDEIAPFF